MSAVEDMVMVPICRVFYLGICQKYVTLDETNARIIAAAEIGIAQQKEAG